MEIHVSLEIISEIGRNRQFIHPFDFINPLSEPVFPDIENLNRFCCELKNDIVCGAQEKS